MVEEEEKSGGGGGKRGHQSDNKATFVAHLASQDFSDFQLG